MKWPVSFVIATLSPHNLRSLVRSCSRRTSLVAAGKNLHAALTTTGALASPDAFLRNALLHFYAASKIPSHARKLFDQIPTSHKDAADWTALMLCLDPGDSLRLFAEMRSSRVEVDDVALVSALNASSRLRDAAAGAAIHAAAEKEGFGSGVRVCNAVMDVYVKCGRLSSAVRVFGLMATKSVVSWTVILDGTVGLEGVRKGRAVFDAMPERNEVAWTVMVAGYIAAGSTVEALNLLREMIFDRGLSPNRVTLCSILSAASLSGDLAAGKWIHAYSLKNGETDVMVETALVDMYAKCGRIESAIRVFDGMPMKNVVTWNAMIGGLAVHGRGEAAEDLFRRMTTEEGVKPDELTFTSLLSACSHSGLVDSGIAHFRGLVGPMVEHYACVVDLLGRAGRVKEAAHFATQMWVLPNEVVLGSLLASCGVHGDDLDLGERVVREMTRVNPGNADCHVSISNMYARLGKADRANAFRRGVRKVPGTSSVRVDGEVQHFFAGEFVRQG